MSMTANDFAIITYSELQQLNDEDLALCVSRDAAIKICKKSIDCTEAACNEIFHLWVHKLNKIYEVENCSAEEWQQLMEFFYEIVQQVLTTSEVFDKKLVPTDILSMLCDASELLQWFHKHHTQLGIEKCGITLQFVLQTLSRFFAYYRSNPTLCSLPEILQQALLLYNFVLQVLNENLDICKIDDFVELTRLTEVQATLCMLIEDAPPINLKTIIESWKSVTKLTIHCANFSNTLNSERKQLIVVMASRPIIFLLTEIRRSLNIIYKEDTLVQPIEQVEKYLRITNFYLKLLQRLADAFRHELFPCPGEFLEIFIKSKTPPKYLSNTELVGIVEKYVMHDLREIFEKVYKNQQISEMLLSESSHQKSTDFKIIAKEFVRATLVDKQEIFINEKIDLFIRIFQCSAKDVQNFCDSLAYNEILELFAALAILNNRGEFKKYLRATILREDFILAHASMDVLLTIAHSCHTNSDELLQNFCYWRQCNKNFAIFTTNPRELQVCLLLAHYYTLCQGKGLINKTEFFNAEFELAKVLSSDYRLFIALPEASNLVDKKLKNLVESFVKCKVPESVDDYYGMLIKLKCLSSNNAALNKENVREQTLSNILSIALNVMNALALDLRNFSRLLAAVLELKAKYFQQLDEAAILSILHILRQHAAKLDDCVLPALYMFVQAAHATTQKFESITAELLSQLATKPNAKLLENVFIFKKLQNIENCKINVSLFRRLIIKPFVKHCCKSNVNCHSQPAKRLRIEADEGLKFMLNDLHNKSQQLLDLDAKFDAHDLHLINSIKHNLNLMFSKQQATNES